MVFIVFFSLAILLFAPSFSVEENELSIDYAQTDAQFVFGGPVVYFPCTCSAGTVYYVVIGPPSMGYFSYTVGTQGYANYNMPFARYALGLYTPGTGACWMGVTPYCYTMPTTGFMTNTLGSSS